MELIIYRANSRGQSNHGWLHSFHTFSFARYFNPNRMGFGVLRVINDDTIAPNSGFGTHGHRDMEIISIPIFGELRHKDSMSNIRVISENEVQVMSAGTGVQHSEFNNSSQDKANFLQIWIMPKEKGIAPRYEQKTFDIQSQKNNWITMVSPDSREGSLRIHQEAFLSRGIFEKAKVARYKLEKEHHGLFLMNLSGHFSILPHGDVAEELVLEGKDAVALWEFDEVELSFCEESDVLAIEIPMY